MKKQFILAALVSAACSTVPRHVPAVDNSPEKKAETQHMLEEAKARQVDKYAPQTFSYAERAMQRDEVAKARGWLESAERKAEVTRNIVPALRISPRNELEAKRLTAELEQDPYSYDPCDLQYRAHQISLRSRDVDEASRLPSHLLGRLRAEFDPSEAQVILDGNDILVRLNGLKFNVNQSDIPASAEPLLAKVRNVFQDLSIKDVIVEGHADPSGAPHFNELLAEKRAKAVQARLETATNTEAISHGTSDPVADNSTAEGQQENRRVDLRVAEF